MKEEMLTLTTEWDKTFPKSDIVDHKKVTFHNRYGITLAADMYIPKGADGKLPAIAVSGPFGAVKEQSSGLYAQTLAERGFLTIAFDPSFTGESGGQPRYMASAVVISFDVLGSVCFFVLSVSHCRRFLKCSFDGHMDEIIMKAHGGVGLRHITKKELETIALVVPPKAVQDRFVAFAAQTDKSKFAVLLTGSNLNLSRCLETP